MHMQTETRAGNHQRHTRTRNASLPTQANNTAHGARKQPPNQGAIHAASEDTTHTSNHTACHQCSRRRPARHPPRAQQVPSQRTHKLKMVGSVCCKETRWSSWWGVGRCTCVEVPSFCAWATQLVNLTLHSKQCGHVLHFHPACSCMCRCCRHSHAEPQG